jgi:hypothetical protein
MHGGMGAPAHPRVRVSVCVCARVVPLSDDDYSGRPAAVEVGILGIDKGSFEVGNSN